MGEISYCSDSHGDSQAPEFEISTDLADFLQILSTTFWGPKEYFWETILYNMVEPNFTDVLRLRVTLCLKNMFRLKTVVRFLILWNVRNLMEISHYYFVRQISQFWVKFGTAYSEGLIIKFNEVFIPMHIIGSVSLRPPPLKLPYCVCKLTNM